MTKDTGNSGLSSPFRGTGGFILHLADSALVLGQRNAEWTAHGPVLEQDIAITNIALDLIGQARNFFAYAAQAYNESKDAGKASFNNLLPRPWIAFNRELQEDDLAFLRDERQYLNLLLCELPKGDWAFTILRQYLFSAYQLPLFQQLAQGSDQQLAAIAAKGIKEVTYHLRWSAEWVIRLGDGTEESNRRINKALTELWPYTAELFEPSQIELDAAASGIPIRLEEVQVSWQNHIHRVFGEAGLTVPTNKPFQKGGKAGIHTEHMGHLLAEMQYLQRTYPNQQW
ncbi:phenylacetate-CoA oxygenase subunit PaaI [Cnuella takakiae]|nr:phenylacetate-CoA oxygenase subunit PaaI [Cnuella takakiae]